MVEALDKLHGTEAALVPHVDALGRGARAVLAEGQERPDGRPEGDAAHGDAEKLPELSLRIGLWEQALNRFGNCILEGIIEKLGRIIPDTICEVATPE